MNIPTKGEILDLFEEYDVPDNIRRHCALVGKIAGFLARMLREAGEDVNVELAEAGGQLHDLDKLMTLKTDKHGLVTKEILTRKGFPEVAHVAEMHRFIHCINDDLDSWETKIVNYADKRVKHDELVSVKERAEDLLSRYPEFAASKEQQKGVKTVYKLEKEIFSKIGLKPEELDDMING